LAGLDVQAMDDCAEKRAEKFQLSLTGPNDNSESVACKLSVDCGVLINLLLDETWSLYYGSK